VLLGALFTANAAISCLEATIGMFATRTLGLDTSAVGFLFMVTAIPSVTGAKLAGPLGALADGKKRWRVAFAGMLIQGGFFALQGAPITFVTVVTVEIIAMLGLGLGMGLVDGTCPAMLAEQSELFHSGTGVVYTLSTAATQMGFLLGPVGGSAVMAGYSFGVMCMVLGAVMWLFAPLIPCVYQTAKEPPTSGVKEGEQKEKEDLLGKGEGGAGWGMQVIDLRPARDRAAGLAAVPGSGSGAPAGGGRGSKQAQLLQKEGPAAGTLEGGGE
jgi:DHA1 family multidrug resistance protein-like MFS transporter